jgi:hypothetical protein
MLTMAPALLLAAFQGTVTWQSDLDDRTHVVTITRPAIGARSGPLTAVVVWRGEPGWQLARSPADRARIDSLARWRLIGDRIYLGAVSKLFPLVSHPDSALVVMVDVSRPESLTTATALIGAGALPAEFWPRSWRSGDTTFTVSLSPPRRIAMLYNALGASPVIANFLLFDPADRSPRVAAIRMVGPFTIEEQTVAAFRPAVPAVDTGGACPTRPPMEFRGSRMLTYEFGSADKPWRRVTVAVDTLGRVAFYSDLRGSATLGPEPARDAGHGTAISFSATSTGIMANNFNSETMPGRFRLFGDRALEAANLGPIGPMIERVRKECGSR